MWWRSDRGGAEARCHPKMDTMDRYVEWSDNMYASVEEYVDNEARVKIPFMRYQVGDVVQVRVRYVEGQVYVNEKLVKFVIED